MPQLKRLYLLPSRRSVKMNRLKSWKPDTFHTIIIDEAHHAAAESSNSE